MGYPTKANRFAVQFTVMADAFVEDQTRLVEIQCKTIKACHKLRLQFYAFRTAARKDGEINQYLILDGVEATIDREEFIVKFQLKDYSDLAMALDQGLRDSGIETGVELPGRKKTPL
jgi:hypothetical protein